jgi:hypothetical protein
MVLHLQHADDPPRPDPLARWRFSVRPVRDGYEGVTIDRTEYVMTESEMMLLREMLDNGIHRLRYHARRAAIKAAKRAT